MINQKIEKIIFESKYIELICLLDVDNFGSFNKTYGFEAGNIKLTELDNLGANYKYFKNWMRLGSDEYFFTAPSDFVTNKVHFFNLLQEIENKLNITVSVGVISFNEINKNIEQLFNTLHINVQLAKEYGKNKIYVST